MIEKADKTTLATLVGQEVRWDCELAPYTSFGIGGPAAALVVIEQLSELTDVLGFCSRKQIPYRFIGRGTNILVADAGFDGVVLLFGKNLSQIEVIEEQREETVTVRVGAGCSLARLLKWCSERGFAGLEFAVGIPGSVGGAVVMNAGAMAGQVADVITSVDVFSLGEGEKRITREELDFSYRLWGNRLNAAGEERLVTAATLTLSKGSPQQVEQICREYLKERKGKQPKGVRNAGSFFKNPPGDSAGRLIEAAGLKGTRCGDAMVSDVHANFFVNVGAAKARDIMELQQIVTSRVKEVSGIELQAEVHFL